MVGKEKKKEKRAQESRRDSSKDKHNSKPVQMRASPLKGSVKDNSCGKVPSKRGADYNYSSGNHPKRGKKSNDQSVSEPDVTEPRERQLDLTKNGDKASNKKSKTEKEVFGKGETGENERSGRDDIGIDTLLAGAAAHEEGGLGEGGVLRSMRSGEVVVGVFLVLVVLVAGATAGPITGILVHGCHLQATGLCPAAELRAACFC